MRVLLKLDQVDTLDQLISTPITNWLTSNSALLQSCNKIVLIIPSLAYKKHCKIATYFRRKYRRKEALDTFLIKMLLTVGQLMASWK